MKKNLSELNKDLKNATTLMGVFLGIFLVSVIIGIFDFIKDKSINPIFFNALGMVFLVIFYYKKLKNIKAEIKSRK